MRVSTSALRLPFKGTTTQLHYLLQETLRGLRRGGWMNWAAVSTVTVLLFLLGVSLQTNWQVGSLLQQVGSQLEISVYLKPDLAGTTLQPQIEQFPEVASVTVVPRETSWQRLLEDLGATDIQGATEALGENPLVDELKVRTFNVDSVAALATTVSRFAEVDRVSYLGEAIQNILQLNRGLAQVGWVVIGLLTLTALAVINTTIRLIVVARHQEIEVMQLVGATTTWIYLPFVLQGLFFGVLGAGMAWIFITGSRHFMGQMLASQPDFLQSLASGLQLSPGEMVLLPTILFISGGCIGLLGSFLAVRRFVLR